MSGHSKWATIKHKKAATDAKRAKAFTQLARAITVAAKKGGDPTFNFALRLAIDKAKAGNVPKDNIDRAVKRGTGELAGEEIHENRYEGYAPHGVAVIVDTLTDNPNRTVSELKHLFSKQGGNLEGSVAWQFEQKGAIVIPGQGKKAQDEEWLLEGIDHGIEEADASDGDLYLQTEPDKLQVAKDWLEKQSLEIESAELTMMPKDTIPLNEEQQASIEKLLEVIDEHDDVDRVYHNGEMK